MAKTLENLPQFTVGAIRITEHGSAEIVGTFNHVLGVRAGRSWLYVDHGESMIGDLTEFNPTARTGQFLAHWPKPGLAVGNRFAYVDGYWDAADVAMVLDEEHRWNRVRFQPKDAAMFQGEGHNKLCEAAKVKPEDGTPDSIIPGGWDHEHCKLCNVHIAFAPLGQPFGYVNEDETWLCESCYEKYVLEHDLSFMDRSLPSA